jgi:hypothetical protein
MFLPLEIERDRVDRLLLETRGDLGRQPDNAGGILRNSCRIIANQPSCECQLAVKSGQ